MTTAPPRFFPGLVGVLLVTLLVVVSAQQAAPSGEEVYVDRLGCWNCHGKTGGGGAGAVIAKTRLPLRRFAGYVRLPSKEMPPYAPLLASDDELAIVYRWLDGVDVVKTPPPIAVDLKSATGVRADGQTKAQVDVEVAAHAADTAGVSATPDAASLRYRLTLITNANGPLANQPVEYQLANHNDWSTVATDEHGEALLDQGRGFARLRTALPAGKAALVVEALDYTAPDSPVVVGMGTAVLKVE